MENKMETLEDRCDFTCDFLYMDDEKNNSKCKNDCLDNIKNHIKLKDKSSFVVQILIVVVIVLLVGIWLRLSKINSMA